MEVECFGFSEAGSGVHVSMRKAKKPDSERKDGCAKVGDHNEHEDGSVSGCPGRHKIQDGQTQGKLPSLTWHICHSDHGAFIA